MKPSFLLFCCLFSISCFANTWQVGPTRTYTKPSQVSNLVQNGDTVLIDAGTYANDVARFTAHNLLLRGVGGLAHLQCGGTVYGGKAIWVLVGNDVTVENIEFSEAACPDLNGAGIRSEGINLIIRHCYFHDNENGILAGDIASGDFLIEYCEFKGNGYANGLAHNLYINHAHSLIFRYNYTHDAKVGHELKSRALSNYIYCNRFSDENGSASRSIDLPNGGFSVIVGNVIVQDQFSENNNIVGYGLEGLNNPSSELYVAYNTFVNNKSVGSFLQIASGTAKLKAYNNIFAGPGNVIVGNATSLDTMANRVAPVADFGFANAAAYDFHIAAGSIAAGIAADPGMAGTIDLRPEQSYVHPTNFEVRTSSIDAGAYSVPGASGFPAVARSPFTLHPNPARNVMILDGPDVVTTLFIMDIQGKLLKTPLSSRQLNLQDLPAGLYFLRIQTKTGAMILPFVKQ